jgi:putative methionine-R-sulfoxide reductase with GAF domain
LTETSVQPYAGALEAVHRILNREPEADDALRQIVSILHHRIEHFRWVAIAFVEEDELTLGPTAGERTGGGRLLEVPVEYQGAQVGALHVEADAAEPAEEEHSFLRRIAVLVSGHCLVGWDTGGVPWSEVT